MDAVDDGADIGIKELPSKSFICKNNLSAIKQPKVVESLIEKEKGKGYIIGPYKKPPFDIFRIHPISIADKKYATVPKPRFVLDYSSPHENDEHASLNDLISKEEFSLTYTKIEEAVAIIQKLGKGSYLCKTDLTDAFKNIPVKEKYYPFQGFRWKGKYYFYTRLVFGCRSSPYIFDKLSKAIAWIATNKYGIEHIKYLLDDFLTIDPPTSLENAYRTMALLTMILRKLKLAYSLPKTIGPVQALEYLGIILDTVLFQMRLPEDKLTRIIAMVKTFLGLSVCTKREMLSLCGNLSFSTRCIPAGRSFMYRLFRVAHSVKPLNKEVFITPEAKNDLKMWLHFLENWNGVSLFLETEESHANHMDLFTDASGTLGFGGYFRGEWFYGEWPEEILDRLTKRVSICFQELLPVVVAAILWGKHWSRKRIIFHCDNEGAVYILNKGTSSCPDIMKLMRRLTLVAAEHSFSYTALHIPGRLNKIADKISRLQFQEFRRLAPNANLHPCALPPLSSVMFN